jgi:hypothetical protein
MARFGTAILGIVTLGAGVVIAAQPASAAAVDGVIGIRGPGSVYAGTDLPHFGESALVTKPTKAGVAASFAAEVLNVGSSLAQFRVSVVVDTLGTVPQLLVGSTNVTSLALGPGYVTPPLAVGKSNLLTLKLTPPPTAQPADAYFVHLALSSVDGTSNFGTVDAGAIIGSTVAGTSDHDILATSSGQPTIRGEDFTHGNGFIDAITAPTIKVGGTALFGLTLKNDASATTQMQVELNSDFGCPAAAASWSFHLKFGNSDITAAASGPFPGWVSPATAPGRSFKLTLSAKALSLPSATGCANFYLPSVTVHSTGPDQQYEEVFLLANVV